MRYAGIDYGTKRIGVAFSDEIGTMGFPYGTIKNDGRALQTLSALCREKGVGAVVFGESRTLSGGENKVAPEAKQFAEQLTAETGLSVYFEPEMFTTQEARRHPDGEHQGSIEVDAQAAAIILTSYLSRHDHA